MFVLFSLLATSVDGFVSGFMAGAMGIAIKAKDGLYAFLIIFSYCAMAAQAGGFLAQTGAGEYLDIVGIAVMLYLARSALKGNSGKTENTGKITAISISVAADAGVACRYLAMCGYDAWLVSLASAALHSMLMVTARKISRKIIRTDWLKYTQYMSAVFFAGMAVYKLLQL